VDLLACLRIGVKNAAIPPIADDLRIGVEVQAHGIRRLLMRYGQVNIGYGATPSFQHFCQQAFGA
jgi:hypothetical protein